MILTNLKLVLRRLVKQPVFFGINGIGLTMGILAFLFILQYVIFQWSYNTSYEARDRSYRLLDGPKGEELDPYVAPGWVPRIKENIPGVELAARYMYGIGAGVIVIEDPSLNEPKSFRQHELAFVDNDFLEIFKLETLAGTPDLTQPNTVILTESTAMQYYQSTDVVGQTLKLINQFGEHPFTVSAVLEDFPVNSDIQCSVLASMPTFESEAYIGYNTWMDINTLKSSFVWSFFRLQNPSVKDNVLNYIQNIAKETLSVDELGVALQTVEKMHLDKGEAGNLPSFGNAQLVWFLLILAILILGIAWINYINLSTAQAIKKAHAVSVRKVIGAKRRHLIQQQLTETFALTSFSVLLALVACFFLQPFFNYLVDLPLSLSILLDWKFLTGILSFLILTTLAAGFYVAFVVTGFDPALLLKGSFSALGKGALVRKVLVSTQFAISIAFIIGTGIMLMQINFLQEKDLGFATDRRLSILGPADFSAETVKSKNSFLNEIEQLPYVGDYSASGGIPGRGVNFSFSKLNRDRDRLDEEQQSFSMVFIDENYFDIYGMEFLAGKGPTAAMVEAGWWNSKKIVINATTSQLLGFENPANAVQQTLYYEDRGQIEAFEVLGVVKDYNHQSLHNEMTPMVFGPGRNHVWFTLLMEGEQSQQQLASLESLYKEHFPKSPFIYQYVDDYYYSFYEADRRLGQLISTATFFAIFISCLGLLGLVAHTVERRTKEIGIRKVLGAGIRSIVTLISKDFIPLILIALVFAAPGAYYFMNTWLEDFAYHIVIPWWIFLVAGLGAVLIALATVSFQSIKAALANPVDALRNE